MNRNEMKRCLQYIFVQFFFFIPAQGQSQPNNIATWLTYTANHKIGKHINVFTDIQCRSTDIFKHVNQYSYRAGVGYYLTGSQNISLNYMVADSKVFDEDYFLKTSFEERRIFEQYQVKLQKTNTIYNHRFRLEQRFFTNANYANRLRYYVGIQQSIFQKKFKPKSTYVNLYEELYLNLQNNLYDRIRLSAGIGYIFNSSFKIDWNYLFQTLQGHTSHQVVLNFVHNTTWIK